MPEYEDYPRPEGDYYEIFHDYLTQGDIFTDVPISQLGPELLVLEDPPPSALPIPDTMLPVVTYVWTTGLGMVLSDTCLFRHPKASAVDANPRAYGRPDSVYHNGFLRVAPIFKISDCPWIPHDENVYATMRTYDHMRRFMYLPELRDEAGLTLLSEGVVALQMADLLSLDLMRSLRRVTQLTYVARQQLNRKLVYFDTGAQAEAVDFDPDMD